MANIIDAATPRTDMFVADYVIANYQIGSGEATDVTINQMAAMEQEIDQLSKQCGSFIKEIAALKSTIEAMKENNHN